MDRSSASGPRLTLEMVRDIIAKEESDVDVQSLEEETGSGRGDNYTSMLYRVRAKGRKQLTSEESVPWERAIIYKVLPVSRARREAFKSEVLFRNEVAFYTHVWPALNKLQANGKKVFGGVAKIYVARGDLIAMEDFRERGYTMVDRRQGLEVHHLKLVLKALAGFHALSLTLRNTRYSTDSRRFSSGSSDRKKSASRRVLTEIKLFTIL